MYHCWVTCGLWVRRAFALWPAPFAEHAFIIPCDCSFHVSTSKTSPSWILMFGHLNLYEGTGEPWFSPKHWAFVASIKIDWRCNCSVHTEINLAFSGCLHAAASAFVCGGRLTALRAELWSCNAAARWRVLSETKSQKESCSRRVTPFTLINNSSLCWACWFIAGECLFGAWGEVCFLWMLVY